MRISKYIKPLGFPVFLIIVNMILCFLLEPANGASGEMWSAYEQETEIDTLFVGSSVSSATFDPLIINDESGIQAFNLGTPSQSIRQTFYAVKKVVLEHDIKLIVFGMDFFSLQENVSRKATLTFENKKAKSENWMIDGIRYICSEEVRGTEDSINYLFPWVYNSVNISGEAVVNNIKQKIQPISETFMADSLTRRDWKLQKGYRPYTGIDFSQDRWLVNSYYTYPQVFSEDSVEIFKQFMAFCIGEEINLVVVNVPNPVYDVISCVDTYAENDKKVRALCSEYGVEYFDFSLVKPELFELKPEFFYNFEHLNYRGSQEFSKMFGKFMKEWETKGDMTEYFYGVDEFYELHDDMVQEWKQVQM